jgi:hypothetical protein
VNKVSEFPGRKPEDQPAPAASGPYLGGDQGDGARPPCGSCVHWRKATKLGLGLGMCMEAPPLPAPMTDKAGNIVSQSLSRPILPAAYEGCDRWDDGAEDEEGEPAIPGTHELVEVDDVATGQRRKIAVPR